MSQISIIGDGKSSVSRNQCETAGGGINAYSSKTSIQELTLEQNSASRGGGINTHNDSVSLYKLVITGNTASTYGGGAAITSLIAMDTLCSNYSHFHLIYQVVCMRNVIGLFLKISRYINVGIGLYQKPIFCHILAARP